MSCSRRHEELRSLSSALGRLDAALVALIFFLPGVMVSAIRELSSEAEVAAHFAGQGVIAAQDPSTASEGSFVERDRFRQTPRFTVGGGKVAIGAHGAGMIGAKYAPPIGQGPFVKVDRICQASRFAVGGGEVVARAQGSGMVGAE